MAHVLPKVTVRTWRLVVTNEKLADVLAKILANGEWLAAANDKANSFFFFSKLSKDKTNSKSPKNNS